MDAELARLSVVIDARMDKLEEKLNKSVRASYGAAAKMEKAFNKANIGKGLENQFAGVAKGSLLGSTALDSFSRSGLFATGAVAGLVLALQGVRGALAFADELDAASTKIGVTAEALQELRFAGEEFDITTEDMDKSLRGLNNALGAYMTGVGNAKVKKAFEALGFTRKDLADVRNAADLLPMLADRMAKLQTTAERVKLAKALGAEDLVPLLEQGSGALDKATDRVRKLGFVMSNELTKEAADANRELEVMWQVITGKATIALADLGVWAIRTAQDMAPLIARVKEFAERSRDAFSSPEFRDRFPVLADDKVGARTAYEYDQARRRAAREGRVLPTREEIREDARRGPQARGRGRSAQTPKATPAPTTTDYSDEPAGGGGGGGGSGASRADIAARQKLIELEDQLADAEARGDSRRVAALREQMELERLIARYRAGGYSAAQADAMAEDRLAAQRAALQLEQERRRYMIELEDQLALAQATGDARRIRALEDQLEVVRQIARYAEAGHDSMTATWMATDRVRAQREAEDQRAQFEASVVRPDQNVELDDPLEPKVARGGRLMTPEEDEAVRRQWADAIGGGLRAAIHGGTPALAEYFAQTMTEALINDLSYELAGLLRNWLGGLGGPVGAGEGGGLLSSLGGMLGGMLGGPRGTPGIGFGQPGIGFGQSGFAGKFATGGTIPKGQWGIVGDPARSGEPVRWSPSGIEVMPNSTLRALRSLRAPAAQRAGGNVSMSMSVSLAGANGDSALRVAMQQAAALGAKRAIETVNRSAPLRQVRLEQLGHVGA